jgi:hypothetical protein
MNNNESGNAPATTSRMLYWAGMTLIAAALCFGLIEPVLTLGRFVPLDPNEGWNALFAEIAMRGGALYPSPGGLIINNYPPLSFYIVGGLGRLMGDNIYAGRLVALVSMLIVAANIHVWLRSTGSGRRVALLGAGLFAALSVTYARGYAGMNDPQWLAHAIMTTGMVVLWRGNASFRAIVLGSLLMIAAGFTKHLLIPLPIAVTWWLMRRSRPAFMTWVACSALLLAAITLAAWWLYGTAFFESLDSARQYSLHQGIKVTRRALKCFAPIIALAVMLLPYARRSERNEFAAVYFLVAALVSAAASGGVGVDINAFFDLMIAASLCAALTVETLWARRVPGPSRAIEAGSALTLMLGLYLAAYAASIVPAVLREIRGLDALEAETRAATRLVESAGGGRAACETPELCYWGKSEFTLDFFNYGQRLKVGKQPFTPCASAFDGRRIPLVQLLPNDGQGSKQLPPDCNAVILQNYRPVMVSSLGVILAPSRP